jgi:hypothetical protein
MVKCNTFGPFVLKNSGSTYFTHRLISLLTTKNSPYIHWFWADKKQIILCVSPQCYMRPMFDHLSSLKIFPAKAIMHNHQTGKFTMTICLHIQHCLCGNFLINTVFRLPELSKLEKAKI